MTPLTSANWKERAGSMVRAALNTTYRERAALMGKGFAIYHVPGTLHILVSATFDPPPAPYDKILDLSPTWGNETAAIHALDVLAKRPLPFGKDGAE